MKIVSKIKEYSDVIDQELFRLLQIHNTWFEHYVEECVYPSGHSFFHTEKPNFTVVPKRPFVFLQQNTKFYCCTQTAIRFFTAKYKILQLYPNGNSFFTVKYKILQLYPNVHSFFTAKYKI